ncbi:MAG: SGNH/GDSL hydrolase family protein [Actinobacteria bacterium]|nr:SGNH/GDSL hydrolase family protein [Actinomycetota bacterium]
MSSPCIPDTSSPRSRPWSTSARATTSSQRTAACPSRSRSRRIPAAEQIVVAALGDSITEGSPGYDSRKGGDETSQWEHWAARADGRLEFRNCGIHGQRTDEIMARLDECAGGADVLVVQGGINDIAQGRSVDAAAENLRAMVRRGKELGLQVLLVELLPWNNGWPAAEPKIRKLNELIAEVARVEDVALLPFHDTLEDRDRPGRMREEWTSDGDHPSVEGYRRLGELAFSLPG